MTSRVYAKRIEQVRAIQLVATEDGQDNAAEVARFCEGTATWKYDPETEETQVRVVLRDNVAGVRPGEWVCRREGGFVVYADEAFHKIFYTDFYEPVPTCSFCLADVQNTPQADPGEKSCPVCGARYSGSARKHEYEVLSAVGLTKDA